MDALDDPDEFGKRVAAARAYVGESQGDFAKRLGYEGSSTIYRWELGKLGKKKNSREGRWEVAEKIIRATGCPRGLFDLSTESAEQGAKLARLEEELEGLRAQVRAIAREQEHISQEDRNSSQGDHGHGLEDQDNG